MTPINENCPAEESCSATASRRDFLRRAAKGVSGAAFIVFAASAVDGDTSHTVGIGEQDPGQEPGQKPEPKQAGKAAPPTAESSTTAPGYDPHAHRYAFLLDVTKCIGCGACVRACERENNVPKDYFRTWVERYTVSRGGHVEVDSPDGGKEGFQPLVTDREVSKAFFVPKMCNQCTETPCVQLCPVGASYRSPDGLILVDESRCIGCGYCVQACPYGSRFVHPETHVASKCTLCYHRITKGLQTACVQACPAGARKLGDLKKLGDEVAELLATTHVQVLKPELHTQPNCHYVGLSQEVR